jgi:23S rRNA (uracil1939-C5)-methyltransferase
MTLTIERLGQMGDGIGQGPAGPVFAPLTLPGEVVEGDIVDGRIETPRIVTPSANRVRPPCSHFKACGGCSVQHASDAFVQTWKADVVRAALSARDLPTPIRNVHTSPAQSRRRATLAGKRTKSGAMIGFHARGSATVIEVPNCQLLVPQIVALFPALQELTVIGASRKAELALTVTWSDAGADIAVKGGKPLDGPLRAELAAFINKHNVARLTWADDLVGQNRAPIQSIEGISIAPPPGAFLQATADGEHALVTAVIEAVGTAKHVADLFAGCGTFALPLARTAEVHAVESVAEMLGALDAGWRNARGLKKVTTEKRDLFRRPMVPLELRHFDAVVLDPPRAGAEAQIEQIIDSVVSRIVPRIVMVSCNPVTFARDAEMLVSAGYVIDWVDVVDQFRWSGHVELVAQFTKPHMSRKSR